MISYIYGNRPWTGHMLLTMLHWISIIITFPVNLEIPWIGPTLQPWIVVFWLQSASSSFLLPASSGGSLSRPLFACCANGQRLH
ncbi:hypothetical protein CDAR_86231 [Caerostris darwini]|uniref:Uncharacterized protein n=1 Tax=Caerostris darwini TaxID=1538125 RepID=A0AAV4S8Z3_9ARAC|nr:hypothetical protein CDAR_86231 [Caerostris darwini]